MEGLAWRESPERERREGGQEGTEKVKDRELIGREGVAQTEPNLVVCIPGALSLNLRAHTQFLLSTSYFSIQNYSKTQPAMCSEKEEKLHSVHVITLVSGYICFRVPSVQ